MVKMNGWQNTGSNGRASAVWVRSVIRSIPARTVEIWVMPYRCMVDFWLGGGRIIEGNPFDTLEDAKKAAEIWLDEK